MKKLKSIRRKSRSGGNYGTYTIPLPYSVNGINKSSINRAWSVNGGNHYGFCSGSGIEDYMYSLSANELFRCESGK